MEGYGEPRNFKDLEEGGDKVQQFTTIARSDRQMRRNHNYGEYHKTLTILHRLI